MGLVTECTRKHSDNGGCGATGRCNKQGNEQSGKEERNEGRNLQVGGLGQVGLMGAENIMASDGEKKCERTASGRPFDKMRERKVAFYLLSTFFGQVEDRQCPGNNKAQAL